MPETEAPEMLDTRVRAYLDNEMRQAEADFARLPMPSTSRAARRGALAPLLAGGLMVAAVVIAAGSVFGRPRTSAVAVPSTASGSGAPSSSSWASPGSPLIDCGRIGADACATAITLARAAAGPNLDNPTAIVVDDTCPPGSLCDRKFGFDSLVVFVTRRDGSTGMSAVDVTGVDASTPTDAEPWTAELPSHILARVLRLAGAPAPASGPPAAASAPASESSPSPTPTAASSPTPTPAATATPSADPRQLLTCGPGMAEFGASMLDAPALLTGPDRAITALRAYLAGTPYPGMPVDGWRTVAASDTSVTFLAGEPGSWWVVTMELQADGWQPIDEGECRLEVSPPDTMGYATWRLDPSHPPKPGDTTVTVLATESACANGQPPGKRLQPPVVVETSDAVTITILVTGLGAADCPSNPEVPVVVALSEPLGTRALLDGSTYPTTQR